LIFKLVDRSDGTIRHAGFLASLAAPWQERESQPGFPSTAWSYALYTCGTVWNGAYSNPTWIRFPKGYRNLDAHAEARIVEVDGQKTMSNTGWKPGSTVSANEIREREKPLGRSPTAETTSVRHRL
jgi:hypothetical protein